MSQIIAQVDRVVVKESDVVQVAAYNAANKIHYVKRLKKRRDEA